jgi:hypothetical protein
MQLVQDGPPRRHPDILTPLRVRSRPMSEKIKGAFNFEAEHRPIHNW